MSNDPNEAVKLATFTTEVEAQLLVGELADAGVDAQSSGALTASFRVEAPGEVAVLVRQSDLEKAKQVLETFRSEKSGD